MEATAADVDVTALFRRHTVMVGPATGVEALEAALH